MEIIVQKLIEIITELRQILGEMAPYLLLGFAVAGILYVYVPTKIIQRHLGGKGILPSLKASIIGVPLPLCSCGVIPVAASLRQNKASKGATTSFLLSAPQVGVGSIFVTFSLLGPVFAIYRPVIALINGLAGGLLVDRFDPDRDDQESYEMESSSGCEDNCGSGCGTNSSTGESGKFLAAMRYGFVELPRDLGRALIIGLLIAGVITAVVPLDNLPDAFRAGIIPMLFLIAVSIPVYICATAVIPVAAALIIGGVSPGTAFVLLMAGPAINAATIAVVWKTMGKRTVAIYVMSVASLSLISGFLLDYIFTQTVIDSEPACHHLFPHWLNPLSAIILIAIFIYAFIRQPDSRLNDEMPSEQNFTDIQVSGMTCTHCKNAVEQAINESPGVNEVQVDLKTGMVRIIGDKFDIDVIRKKITGLGYPVK